MWPQQDLPSRSWTGHSGQSARVITDWCEIDHLFSECTMWMGTGRLSLRKCRASSTPSMQWWGQTRQEWTLCKQELLIGSNIYLEKIWKPLIYFIYCRPRYKRYFSIFKQNFHPLIQAVIERGLESPEQRSENIFKRMDINSDGRVEKKEFVRCCMEDKKLIGLLTPQALG